MTRLGRGDAAGVARSGGKAVGAGGRGAGASDLAAAQQAGGTCHQEGRVGSSGGLWSLTAGLPSTGSQSRAGPAAPAAPSTRASPADWAGPRRPGQPLGAPWRVKPESRCPAARSQWQCQHLPSSLKRWAQKLWPPEAAPPTVLRGAGGGAEVSACGSSCRRPAGDSGRVRTLSPQDPRPPWSPPAC